MKKEKIDTPNAPKAIGPYSQAIKAGNLIFTSGQLPINPFTNEMLQGSFQEQVKQVFFNIEKILEAAGSSLDDVIRVNIFLSDLKLFPEFNEIYQTIFKPPYPARSTVEANLPKSSSIEVDVIAVSKK